MPLETLPCIDPNPCNHMRADFRASRDCWREVSEEFHEEMLGCVPPIDWNNGKFLVGEPYTDTADDTVYCCVTKKINGQHYARYTPRKQANALVAQLKQHLQSLVTA